MATLARTPYSRLQQQDPAVDREFQKIERMGQGLYVPKVIVFARSPYAVLATDTLLVVDATGGAVTLVFPVAARVDGLALDVIKTDASANAVTLQGTFSGSVNPTLAAQYKSKTIRAGNGVYYITAST